MNHFWMPLSFQLQDLSRHIQGLFSDYQNLILKVQINAVPSSAGEGIADFTGKIDAGSNLPTCKFRPNGEKNYELPTACQGNFDRP
jgi:hypothetical protein